MDHVTTIRPGLTVRTDAPSGACSDWLVTSYDEADPDAGVCLRYPTALEADAAHAALALRLATPLAASVSGDSDASGEGVALGELASRVRAAWAAIRDGDVDACRGILADTVTVLDLEAL